MNRIELNPQTIDVVVFCSKDYSPILERLHEISDRFNCYYHYTITAVPSSEPSERGAVVVLMMQLDSIFVLQQATGVGRGTLNRQTTSILTHI